MGRTLRVGVVLLLASLFATGPLAGQHNGGSERVKPRIEQGSPSPLSPGTPISFTLFQEDFEDGKQVVVSLRIRNILGQLVAVPAAVDHPDGSIGVDNLIYTSPGLKEAVWNGNDRNGHPVAAGIYLLELVVNGERAPPLRIVVAD